MDTLQIAAAGAAIACALCAVASSHVKARLHVHLVHRFGHGYRTAHWGARALVALSTLLAGLITALAVLLVRMT